jgi:hypothetical protein
MVAPMPERAMATKVPEGAPPTCGQALRSRIGWLSPVAAGDRAASTGIPLGSAVLVVLYSVAAAAGDKPHLVSVVGNSSEVRRDSQMAAPTVALGSVDTEAVELLAVLPAVVAAEGDTLVAEAVAPMSIAAASTVVAEAVARAIPIPRKLRMWFTMRVLTRRPAALF